MGAPSPPGPLSPPGPFTSPGSTPLPAGTTKASATKATTDPSATTPPGRARRLILHLGPLALELDAGVLWPLVATVWLVAWLVWARSWAVALPLGAVVAISWYASVVAHEAGHALALRALGGRVERICLGRVGAVHAPSPLEPRKALWVALAGPGANLVLTGPGWPAVALGSPSQWWWAMVAIWCLVNTVMAARNLVPSGRTDGAQTLRALRTLRARDGDHAPS
jgi:Zn-dependent protease